VVANICFSIIFYVFKNRKWKLKKDKKSFKSVNLIFIVIYISKNSQKIYITKIEKRKRKKTSLVMALE